LHALHLARAGRLTLDSQRRDRRLLAAPIGRILDPPDQSLRVQTVDQLRDIRAAIDKIGETLSGRQVFDDFIICVDTD